MDQSHNHHDDDPLGLKLASPPTHAHSAHASDNSGTGNRVTDNGGANNRALVAGGVWITLGRLSGVVLQLVLLAIVVRVLPRDQFAEYMLIKSVAVFTSVVISLGLNMGIVRVVSERLGLHDLRGAVQALGQGGLLAIGVSCVTLATAWWLSTRTTSFWFRPSPLAHPESFALMLGTVSGWHRYLAECLRGCGRIRLASVFSGEACGPFVQALMCGVLWTTAQQRIVDVQLVLWIEIAILVLTTPILVGLLAAVSRAWLNELSLNKLANEVALDESSTNTPSPMLSLLAIGIPLLLTQLVFLGNANSDLWLAGWLCDPDDLGGFAAARRLAGVIGMPLGLVQLAIMPEVAKLNAQRRLPDIQRLMSSSALIAAIPALSAALLLICFPKFFLVALFGASYADAATALVWLTLAQCVLTLTGPTGSLLLMTGHTWGLLVIHVLSASLMIAVALLTLPSLGYLGIVYAAVAMLATQNIASWLLARWTNGVWTQVSMASIRRPWLTERRG